MDHATEALAVIATWRPEAICAGLALSDAARACLAQAPAAPAWLAALLHAGCRRDAVTFLAHALPRPQAVRWACDCVEAGVAADPTPAARAAVAAARAWAREPDAARCQAAAQAADRVDHDAENAARLAALAAAWSGESLAPAGQPVVTPAPALGAQAVAAAVTLAASCGHPDTWPTRLDDFIGRGMLGARARGT
jgi:hypothetical protein